MVEAGIYDDGQICCKQDDGGENNKRKGSVVISMISGGWGNE